MRLCRTQVMLTVEVRAVFLPAPLLGQTPGQRTTTNKRLDDGPQDCGTNSQIRASVTHNTRSERRASATFAVGVVPSSSVAPRRNTLNPVSQGSSDKGVGALDYRQALAYHVGMYYVYAFFSREKPSRGSIIYIGATKNFFGRMSGHVSQPWFSEISEHWSLYWDGQPNGGNFGKVPDKSIYKTEEIWPARKRRRRRVEPDWWRAAGLLSSLG